MTKLFDAKPTPEYCPLCQGELVLRKGAFGLFKGCSNYPTCHYQLPLKSHASAQIMKVLDNTACPKCGNVLVLRQGKFGMFISCQDYPACHYSETSDKSEPALQILCPACQKGHLKKRQSRLGKSFYGCERYPDCRLIINGTPAVGECEVCHYPLLIKKKTAAGSLLICANKACAKKQSIR